jgi:flagellar basal-body rod protein FlgF
VDKLLYVAMSGASENAIAQKAHANNLANVSTNGFQRDLEQARSMPVFGEVNPSRAYAMSERPGTDFSSGLDDRYRSRSGRCRARQWLDGGADS